MEALRILGPPVTPALVELARRNGAGGSGAFGVFKRDAVVGVGGFRPNTIGEDMELVTRLHRFYRERVRRFRIVFQPEPICWTQAPESLQTLARQRNRWQRGTLQVLGYHGRMLFNARYGVVGLLAMPYYLVFEAMGPVLENFGYRQLATWWRIVGVVDYFRGKEGWGTMKRKGFAPT